VEFVFLALQGRIQKLMKQRIALLVKVALSHLFLVKSLAPLVLEPTLRTPTKLAAYLHQLVSLVTVWLTTPPLVSLARMERTATSTMPLNAHFVKQEHPLLILVAL
jgi:hypothetical protein